MRSLVVCGLLALGHCSAQLDASPTDLSTKFQAHQSKGSHSRALKSHARQMLQDPEEKEAEARAESMTKWTIVVSIVALALTFAVGHVLDSKGMHFLPEAGVGVIMGFLIAFGGAFYHNEAMLSTERFNFEFFMTWLLPPIIFEAGFNMNVRVFFANAVPTMFYAFIGTGLSTFVVGGMVFWFGQQGWCYPLGMLASLVFGSLISATDPVTVLAVFQSLGVKVDIFSMVFGESVLNDAVAIVLSRTLLSFLYTPVTPDAIMAAGMTFLKIFVGSSIIGAVAGMISAFVFKHLHLKHHEGSMYLETALSFPFPWAAYFISEAMELSGIVTILAAGIVMATYTRVNFSDKAVELTSGVYKCIALVAETYVFVYLGMALVTFPIFDHTVWALFGLAMIACFVGRLHIYLGSFLVNCFRGPESDPPPISSKYNFVMWFSGLRGGVAFALASVSFTNRDFVEHCGGNVDLNIENNPNHLCDNTDSEAILQVTMLIAVFTIFVFGGAITTVARAYDVIADKNAIAAEKPETEEDSFDEAHNYLLRALTWDTAYKGSKTELRFSHASEHVEMSGISLAPPKPFQRMSTRAFKEQISERSFESTVGVAHSESVMHDKLDDLRAAFPHVGGSELAKLLEEANGSVEKATELGKKTIAKKGEMY